MLEQLRNDAEEGTRPSFVRAAEKAGCDVRTVARAWRVGWPGLPPLQDALAEERALTRTALTKERLAAKRDDAPGLAQVDAVEARKEMALSARFARKLTTGFLAELIPLRGWVKKRAERATAINSASMDAGQALSAMREVATVIGRIIDLTARAQAMESVALGDPTEVISVVPMAQEVPMTSEEIVREVGAALRSVARALRDGSVKPSQPALRALAASETVVLFESMDDTLKPPSVRVPTGITVRPAIVDTDGRDVVIHR